MGVIETKVMQVDNDEYTINRVSNIMANFGWTMTNVQVTHSQNTKTYSSAWDQLGGNESKTVETTTINYATLTLQRDKSMAHYQELASLEQEYSGIMGEKSAFADAAPSPWPLWLKVVIWPWGTYCLIKKIISLASAPARRAQKQAAYRDIEARGDAVLMRAAELLA